MITVTRTPSIAVSLDQLSVGMAVKDEDGHIGKIIEINVDCSYPIKVFYDTVETPSYYTEEGFEFIYEDCRSIEDMYKSIELVEGDILGANSAICTDHAQRIAELEADRDNLHELLEGIEAQEPVPNDDIPFLDAPLYARPIPAHEPVAPAIPAGWKLVQVKSAEFDSLMYWLDRCEYKGHLENCPDLIEPWGAFDYRDTVAL